MRYYSAHTRGTSNLLLSYLQDISRTTESTVSKLSGVKFRTNIKHLSRAVFRFKYFRTILSRLETQSMTIGSSDPPRPDTSSPLLPEADLPLLDIEGERLVGRERPMWRPSLSTADVPLVAAVGRVSNRIVILFGGLLASLAALATAAAPIAALVSALALPPGGLPVDLSVLSLKLERKLANAEWTC
jgi:hypothetical protein